MIAVLHFIKTFLLVFDFSILFTKIYRIFQEQFYIHLQVTVNLLIKFHAHTRLDLLQVHSDFQVGMGRFQIVRNETLISL